MTRINSIGVQNLSGQTGTSAFVGSVSAGLTTPLLGTPTSGNLVNCTNIPFSISADSGSAAASSSTITFNGATNAGGSVSFSGSGSTVSLKLTDSQSNTCLGSGALSGTGHTNNVVIGQGSGTTSFGNQNTVCGSGSMTAINSTTAISNVIVGAGSATGLLSGDRNIVIGATGGSAWNGSENSNISINGGAGVASEAHLLRIGAGTGSGNRQLTQAIISGIDGKTSTSGIAVLINSNDVMGTTTSSIRFKENVQDIKDPTDVLMALRPVSFTYKREHMGSEDARHIKEMPVEYGLIAEEAMEHIPELIVYDKEGLPKTIRYLHLDFLMLKEIQKMRNEINELKAAIQSLRKETV